MNTRNDMNRTALAPRGEDPTSAYAWAASPLGDPVDESAELSHGHDFPAVPISRAAGPRSIDKVMVVACLIGALGAGTALGVALFSGSPRPQAVATDSAGAPAAASTFAALAPVPAAVAAPAVPRPDNALQDPAPVVALPDAAPQGQASAAVVAPPPENPAPPADPGAPPAAAPQSPLVMVNVAPPPAVWVPVPVAPPQLPPPPSLPPLPTPPKLPPLPTPPKLPPPPSLCLPPHHIVQGVCK